MRLECERTDALQLLREFLDWRSWIAHPRVTRKTSGFRARDAAPKCKHKSRDHG
jgi:hypothetical protein